MSVAYQIIAADAASQAFFGNPVRMWPLVIPQTNALYPSIVYKKISGRTWQGISDTSNVDQQRIQINVWAADQATADAGQATIRAALENMGALAALGAACEPDNENPDDYDSDTQTFCSSRDYLFQKLR